MKILKVKVNRVIPGYAIGITVNIRADNSGTPLDKFWRDRLRDSETDNCIEIATSKLVSASKEKPTKEKPIQPKKEPSKENTK